MADDFLAALGVADPTAKAKTSSAKLPSDPTDLAVRIAMLEERDPTARKWVAGVMANRAKAKKGDLLGALTEPDAFEPYTTKKAEIAAIDPNSEEYKQTAADLLPILTGKAEDPTGGAMKFYAPEAQKALGRQPPDFEDGKGVDVGQTRFFGGASQAPDDFLGAIGVDPAKAKPAPEEAEFTAANPKMLGYADIKDPADQKVYRVLKEGGVFDPQAPAGSEHHPFFNTDPKQLPPGAYFVQGGKVQRTPGGAKESSAVAGLQQGVEDIGATISHLMPGTDDSQVKSALLANQAIYGAKYGGDTASGAGRFTGQVLGAAPLAAAAEGAVVPMLARMAPEAAAFISGNAGAWKGASAASKLLRVGSLAEAGGNAGAGAAALTSSANPEQSLTSQIVGGYAGGALTGPLAPALRTVGQGAGRLVGSLVEPLTSGGQEKIVSRLLGDISGGYPVRPDLTPIVPGSTPTLAESAGNAGISALERNVRTNPLVAQRFAERQAQNSLARTNLFNSMAGDENSLTRLEDAREAATAGAREAALKGQTVLADVKPVLDTIDTILKGPEGKRREVVKALNDVRENLHDAQGNPETSAEILYGVRKDIGDLLSGKASTERSGAQVATAQLKDVQKALDETIQKVAPGFKEYLKTYSDMSKPIDEQRFLQSLKIADVDGKITLGRVNSAIDKIDTLRKKPGANEAKSVSDTTYEALKSLQADLKRERNIDLGKARGSDSVQNLVTAGIAKAAGVPTDLAAAFGIHPKAAAVMGIGKLVFGSKNPQVLNRLATRLLEPGYAPAPVAPQPGNKLLRGAAKKVVPSASAVSGLATSRLLSGQQ